MISMHDYCVCSHCTLAWLHRFRWNSPLIHPYYPQMDYRSHRPFMTPLEAWTTACCPPDIMIINPSMAQWKNGVDRWAWKRRKKTQLTPKQFSHNRSIISHLISSWIWVGGVRETTNQFGNQFGMAAELAVTGRKEWMLIFFCSSEVLPVPTMRAVRTQFRIPGSEEPTEHSSTASENKEEQHPIKPQASKLFHQAQEELDKHRTQQFNQLGKRMNTKLHSFLKQLDGSIDDNAA